MEKLTIEEKLRILSDAAKYDVSCSSSGSNRQNRKGGLGNGAQNGICHSWSADGRCISLLKILMTNYCIYDCEYCLNRKSNDIERAVLTPKEIVDITLNFYRRNYIEGLFLSSGVLKNPDYTMEQLIRIGKLLRLEENFNGYIHMKIIPGASKELITQLGSYVDRVSVNIEMAENDSLKLLAPDKKMGEIITSMSSVREGINYRLDSRKYLKSTPRFVPAGQTTQMIVGAGGESDFAIINKSQNLYDAFQLKRVYYSAYIPVNKTKALMKVEPTPMIREHRLYQADWLLRFYKFRADELLTEANSLFDLNLDPKANWAINNYDLFPLEVNKASYNQLLRVPGIGIRSAQRIIRARRLNRLNYDDLKKIGVVVKRAKHFIVVDGEYRGYRVNQPEGLKLMLKDGAGEENQQISFFDGMGKSLPGVSLK